MCDSKVLKHINNSIVNTATGLENASVYKVMLFGSYARQDNTDEARIINEGIADYEAGRVVDGKKSLKKMRDKYGV